MDSVNRLGRLVETLRGDLARKPQQTDRTGTNPGRTQRGPQADYHLPATLEELELRVVERLRNLQGEDPEHRLHAGTAIIVEAVLNWEFGPDFALDGNFSRIARQVTRRLYETPEGRKMMEAYLRDIEASAPPRDQSDAGSE